MRDRSYVCGYPRAALRVLAGELLVHALVSALFILAPAGVALSLLLGPWRLALPWHLVGLPLGVVLALVAGWSCWGLMSDLRQRFALRVVPQFSRPLEPEPGTYFSGQKIAASVQQLDALAAGDDVASLSRYGFSPRSDASGSWFDAAEGSATVASLLARVDPSSMLHAELSTWLAALRRAEAAGVGFRLVIVSGTAMNGPHWQSLRAAGF